MLQEQFITDETIFARWIARFLIESNSFEDSCTGSVTFVKQLKQSESFSRCTESSMAYICGDDRCTLFINGDAYTAKPDLAKFLCSDYNYSNERLNAFCNDKTNRLLLNTLYRLAIITPANQ